jgi:heavy metal translocating P-type ATPase
MTSPAHFGNSTIFGAFQKLLRQRHLSIAILAAVGILLHLISRWIPAFTAWQNVPLWIVLALGGLPLTLELLRKVILRKFGSDLLAGISIVTSVLLGEYLAGSLVVLMLSGGETLEAFAIRSASSVLEALARRMPAIAHRRSQGKLADVPLDEVAVGDELVVFPHEFCPVDGIVIDGHGSMDESYLTGEPYLLSKAPGAQVLSGAINGETALTIRADKLPVDSRYAKIMQVMRTSEQHRPQLRRLGDQLGAFYTPLAVGIALAAWFWSGDPIRFLAVVVVATPCPLLIAIPVAIIGAVSLAARLSIVIKDPAILEKLDTCRTAIFDKTGTLTYGRPQLTGLFVAPGIDADQILTQAASLEQYSKHPLAEAVLEAARVRRLALQEVTQISEEPGRGLTGIVEGARASITSRKKLQEASFDEVSQLPATAPGLECVVLVDGHYAATLQFRDQPRAEGKPFIRHLSPQHGLNRILLVSGDRESEARHLAGLVGIQDVYASQSPEQKLEIVRAETALANTLYLGDGINDAPAMTAATVGIAFGSNSDVTAEAAGAVIMDSSLEKVDELLHISRRMRRIALQSAVGGMLLSLGGMMFAAAGLLPPVAGAVFQEIIDVAAVLNALRMSWPPQSLSDFNRPAK